MTHDQWNALNHLQWELYMLCLSCAQEAEVGIGVGLVRGTIGDLLTKTQTREARGRLAVLEGLFGLLDSTRTVPTVSVVPTTPRGALQERVSELLEDAYLLEASALRRFIGFGSNSAAVRRDLRLLTKAIVRRPWAKGVLREALSKVTVGAGPQKALEILSEAIGAGIVGDQGFILVADRMPLKPKAGELLLLPGVSFEGEDWGTIIPNSSDRVKE